MSADAPMEASAMPVPAAAAGEDDAAAKESEAEADAVPIEDEPFEERSLSGRIALVTGASRGLGAELAVNLAKRGIGTLILVARGAEGLEETKARCLKEAESAGPAAAGAAAGGKEAGEAGAGEEAKAAADASAVASGDAPRTAGATPTIDCRPCDLGSPAAIKALFEGIAAAHPHLDILVNNAASMPGYGQHAPLVSDELEIHALNVNVIGTHFVTKYALPMLFKAPAGFQRTVVFTASNEAWLTEPPEGNGMLAYRASKAAVNGAMVALHQTYAATDSAQAAFIRESQAPLLQRVASFHPGFVRTGLGYETEREMEPDLTPAEVARRKAEDDGDFYITVERGVDTMLWLVAAADGAVDSGRTYYQRKPHSF